MLTDGRLDEAASVALFGAFPHLSALWLARFDQPNQQPGTVRLLASVTLERGEPIQAEESVDPSTLHVEVLGSWLQAIVTHCAKRVFEQLEQALTLEPHGRIAEAVKRRVRVSGETRPVISTARTVRRWWRSGAVALNDELRHRARLGIVREIQADARAEIMLAHQLGAEYGDLQRRGFLDVPSRTFPNRTYRVRRGQRIQVLDGGRYTSELCLESRLRVPEADEVLMKVVWLKANEQFVLRTANQFPAARLLL